VNADGKLDLILAAQREDNVYVMLGKGDGTFQPAAVFGAGKSTHRIIAGDWNRDGKLDLATTGSEGASVLLGNGNGTFKPPVAYAAGESLEGILSGDWNGDGKLDLATITGTGTALGTVHVLIGKGDGTFLPAQHYGAHHTGASTVLSVDLDHDGKLDLVMSGGYLSRMGWMRGNGDGTFLAPIDHLTEQSPVGVFYGDWNQDGQPDLALIHRYPAKISILQPLCR